MGTDRRVGPPRIETQEDRKRAQKGQNKPRRSSFAQAIPADGTSQPRALSTAEWNSFWGDPGASAGLSWPDERPDSIMDGGGASVACGSSLSCVDVTPGVWASSDSSTCARCNTTVSLQTCGGRCWAAHDSHCTNLYTPEFLWLITCAHTIAQMTKTHIKYIIYTHCVVQKLEVLEGPNQTHLEQLIKLMLGTLETPGRCVEASWS